jgi:hypothetical protein
MAFTSALVDLLPFPLAVWVTERAAKEGTTPDQLVLTLLEGSKRLIDYADRDRGLPPVPTVWATPLERPSLHDAARMAVVRLREADTPQIHAEMTRQMGFRCVEIGSLRAILSHLVRDGEIRRLRYGVYGPPITGED